jgi:hypothetical protein
MKRFGVGLSVGVALAAVCVLGFVPAGWSWPAAAAGGCRPGSTAPGPTWMSRALARSQRRRWRRCRPAQRPAPEPSASASMSANGPVAQLVEQGTFNPKVAGSIPARPIAKALQGAPCSVSTVMQSAPHGTPSPMQTRVSELGPKARGHEGPRRLQASPSRHVLSRTRAPAPSRRRGRACSRLA